MLSGAVSAQVGSVKDITMAMSQGTQPGFKVLIPEASLKGVERQWEKLMKDYGAKTSKVSKSDDYVSELALIQTIDDKPITIYANFNETPDGVFVNAFFIRGNNYLVASEHPQKAIAARGMLKKFAVATALEAVNEKFEEESKKLSKLEKEQGNLEKDKERYEKDIKKAEETIAERTKDIEDNVEQQSAKKKEISEQQLKVDAIKKKVGKYK